MKRKEQATITKTKSRLRFEIKQISEQGYFEGLLSPYGSVDDGNDVVEPGAYTKTLKDNGPRRVVKYRIPAFNLPSVECN